MRLTPLKAIRAKCLDCSAWQPKEVRFCLVENCPLYPYRFGKNPNRKGISGNLSQSSQKGTAQVRIFKQTLGINSTKHYKARADEVLSEPAPDRAVLTRNV